MKLDLESIDGIIDHFELMATRIGLLGDERYETGIQALIRLRDRMKPKPHSYEPNEYGQVANDPDLHETFGLMHGDFRIP